MEVSIAPVKEITQAVNQAVEDETIIVTPAGHHGPPRSDFRGARGGGGAGWR